MRVRVFGLLCALPCGCGPSESTTATDTVTTTGAASTSTSDVTGPTRTAEPTTDEPPPDLPQVDPETACGALCETQALCWGLEVDPACVSSCIGDLGHGPGDDPGCMIADAALTACLATLSCDVLAEGGYRACDTELRAMLTACQLCHSSAGWVDHDSCYIDDLCPDGLHRVECDTKACICTLDGAFVKFCQSSGCARDGLPNSGFGCCST